MFRVVGFDVRMRGVDSGQKNEELNRGYEDVDCRGDKREIDVDGRVGRKLMNAVRSRDLKFLEHLLRTGCLEKDVLLGKIEGRRARGRKMIKFAASLMEDAQGELAVAGLVRVAQDQNGWRFMIVHVNQDTALR